PDGALGGAAAEGELSWPGRAQLADDVQVAADDVRGSLFDRADARGPARSRWTAEAELYERRAGVRPFTCVHQVRQDRVHSPGSRLDPCRRFLHHHIGVEAAAAGHGDLAVTERVPVPPHRHAPVEPDALEHPLTRRDVTQRPEPDSGIDQWFLD